MVAGLNSNLHKIPNFLLAIIGTGLVLEQVHYYMDLNKGVSDKTTEQGGQGRIWISILFY